MRTGSFLMRLLFILECKMCLAVLQTDAQGHDFHAFLWIIIDKVNLAVNSYFTAQHVYYIYVWLHESLSHIWATAMTYWCTHLLSNAGRFSNYGFRLTPSFILLPWSRLVHALIPLVYGAIALWERQLVTHRQLSVALSHVTTHITLPVLNANRRRMYYHPCKLWIVRLPWERCLLPAETGILSSRWQSVGII